MTATEQDESRQLDAQVSRRIFGAVVKSREDGTLIASIDPDAEETWIELPHCLTDERDDCQVLKTIRDAEHDGCPIVDWESFLDALYDEAMGVLKVLGHRKYEAVAGYVVGAYSRAALTAAGDDQADEPQSLIAWLRSEADAAAQPLEIRSTP